jgi:hypothetical protein
MEREHKFPGSHLVRALGGVDTALWDLRGKRAGRPVCELIGGSLRRIPVYASSMRRDIEPAEEAARLARLQDRHGYRAVKFRVGRERGHDQDEWPGRTEAVVPAVRRAVAEGTALLVDANSCYTPAKAIEVGRMLQDQGVRHFEVRNTARVRPGSRVAVFGCGGIGLNAVQGARLAGAARIVAIDLAEEKLDLARRFGATDVVHAGHEDPAATIRRLMGGVDYAFEAAGREQTAQQAGTQRLTMKGKARQARCACARARPAARPRGTRPGRGPHHRAGARDRR